MHDLLPAVQRRSVELQRPRGERHKLQQHHVRQLAELTDLVELLENPVRPDEVANCLERLREAPPTAGRDDKQVEEARRLAHDAIVDYERAAPQAFVLPGLLERARVRVDESFALLNNLRKPRVVGLAAIVMAMRGQTVASLRAGRVGSIYNGV